MRDTGFVLDLIDAVRLASIRGNRPRAIDRYIDYFGGAATVGSSEGTAPTSASIAPYRRRSAGTASLVRRRSLALALALMVVTVSAVADAWAGPPGDQIRL